MKTEWPGEQQEPETVLTGELNVRAVRSEKALLFETGTLPAVSGDQSKSN